MQLQTKLSFYSPEEYLELEEKADYKSEYRDGEIVVVLLPKVLLNLI